MNHTTIRLAIIIVAATLMITGTIFYPTKTATAGIFSNK